MQVQDPNSSIDSNIQPDFSGGMNLFLDDTKIADNEYREAFNLRNRDGGLKPVPSSVVLDTAPAGLKQGIYGFDTFFVLFVAGNAFVQLIGTTTWIQINGFTMSPTAPFIYAEAVPASTFNFNRTLVSSTNFLGTALNPAINITNSVIAGTPAALVCQDGINQPRIILPDGTQRVTQSYDQWTSDIREYVPIGKQMKYHPTGILLIVSPDGKQLFRSVSGRPIDFVVNVDINGNKGGDATTVSYAMSYNPITNLSIMNTGQIFCGTTLGSFALDFNFDRLIFNEPTFKNTPVFSEVVNNFSFVEILGDYAFISFAGMRSFNAVQQLKNEGRNSVFSLKISAMLEGITQDPLKACAVIFDNYALFSVKTNFGYGILVYDLLKGVWVSFDPTPEPIIQLTVTSIQVGPRLLGISQNLLYEFYSILQPYAQASVKIKSVTSGNAKREIEYRAVRCVFTKNDQDTNVVVTPFIDDFQKESVTQVIKDSRAGINYSVDYPVLFGTKPRIDNIKFAFDGITDTGWKFAPQIVWRSGAALIHAQIDIEEQTQDTPSKQQDSTYLLVQQ